MGKKAEHGCERCAAQDEYNTRRRTVNLVLALRVEGAWPELEREGMRTLGMVSDYLELKGFEVTIQPNVFGDEEFAPIAATFDAMSDYKGELNGGRHRKAADPEEAKRRALEALANVEPGKPAALRRRWETQDYWLRVNTSKDPASLSVNGGYVFDWQPVIRRTPHEEPVLP